MRFHLRWIGTDLDFSERECRNLATRNSWQEPALLLLGPEQNQRLWHTNRLVGRNQRRDIATIASEHYARAAVICLRESQPAKLRRNFDSERAHLREAVDHLLWDFTGAVDFVRVNVLFQKCFEPLEKRIAMIAVFRALRRKWMNLRKIKAAHEEAARKTAFRLGCLARRLGEFERFALRGRHFRGVDDGLRLNCRHKISSRSRPCT